MSNKKFTAKEQEILSLNPWVKKVTENSITYTEAFREHFINQYNLGKGPTQIFSEAGLSPTILGAKRIKCSSERFRKMDKRLDGLKDTRTTNSGRALEHELTDEEKFKRLENENLRLRQQLEFLKKMEFLVKQARYNKSKQEKDIKRLKKH